MKLEILPIENFSGLKYITIFKNNLHNHFGSCRKYYSQSVQRENSANLPTRVSPTIPVIKCEENAEM